MVGFVQQSLELSENSGSSSASVCIELLGGNIDQIIFFEINQVEGSAEGKITFFSECGLVCLNLYVYVYVSVHH